MSLKVQKEPFPTLTNFYWLALGVFWAPSSTCPSIGKGLNTLFYRHIVECNIAIKKEVLMQQFGWVSRFSLMTSHSQILESVELTCMLLLLMFTLRSEPGDYWNCFPRGNKFSLPLGMSVFVCFLFLVTLPLKKKEKKEKKTNCLHPWKWNLLLSISQA